jgi:nucleotide-binding universal stress UspA family protein
VQVLLIPLPVDGSGFSFKAAEYARDFVKAWRGDIILMYSHKPFPSFLGEPYFQEVHDKIMHGAREMMGPFVRLFTDAGVSVDQRLLEGAPGENICRVAAIEKCDLIIMGSRGLSDLKGLFLGSVTHRVLNGAPCPVLVVR